MKSLHMQFVYFILSGESCTGGTYEMFVRFLRVVLFLRQLKDKPGILTPEQGLGLPTDLELQALAEITAILELFGLLIKISQAELKHTTAMLHPAFCQLRQKLEAVEFDIIDLSEIQAVAAARCDRDLPKIRRKVASFSYEGKMALRRALGDLNRRIRPIDNPTDSHLLAMMLHPFFCDLGFVPEGKRQVLVERGEQLLQQHFDKVELARRAKHTDEMSALQTPAHVRSFRAPRLQEARAKKRKMVEDR